MFRSNRQKNISIIVFGIYLLLLVWLILFKFNISISELPHIRNINLIPFGQSLIINGKLNMSEIIYNVLVFVPLGVYIELFMPNKSVFIKFGVGFILSLIFEVIQFIFAIGASDITDLIGNSFGCMIGVVGCFTSKILFETKLINIVNIIGIIVEILAITLISILTIVNM